MTMLSFLLGVIVGAAVLILFALYLAAKPKEEETQHGVSAVGVNMAGNRNQPEPQAVTLQSYNEIMVRNALKIYEGQA